MFMNKKTTSKRMTLFDGLIETNIFFMVSFERMFDNKYLQTSMMRSRPRNVSPWAVELKCIMITLALNTPLTPFIVKSFRTNHITVTRTLVQEGKSNTLLSWLCHSDLVSNAHHLLPLLLLLHLLLLVLSLILVCCVHLDGCCFFCRLFTFIVLI